MGIPAVSLKEFVQKFDGSRPTWDYVPPGFPNVEKLDLSSLTSSEVGKLMAIKTFWEMSRPNRPPSGTRAWQSSNAYRFLVQWTNLVLLRILLQLYFYWLQTSSGSPIKSSTLLYDPLPSSNYRNRKLFDREAAQILDAMRSAVANVEEGWARPTTREYLNFLGYSQASLREVKGDVERLMQDGLLASKPGSGLRDIGIDLATWHAYAKNPANATKLWEFPIGTQRSLKELRGDELTFQIFLELINKTEYTLRTLVASLERRKGQSNY